MIFMMARNDFYRQHIRSFLGIFWAFFQPMVFVGVIYVIFSIGLRGKSELDDGTPFGVYLVCGMAAFNFLSQCLSSVSTVLNSYSYLLSRPEFRISILPLMKIISNLYVHLIFLIMVFAITLISGIEPSIYWLQFPWYTFSAICLMCGVGWITFSISPFVPDVNKLIPVLTRLGFWCTPIFWQLTKFPEQYHNFLMLNPAYYVVDGYRRTLLSKGWFWETGWLNYYFWGLTLFCLILGMYTYKKLRPHFAESL